MNNSKPKCPVCGRIIKGAEIPENRPIELYDNCKKCKLERFVFILIPILFLVSYLFNLTRTKLFNLSELSNIVGIIGTLLLVNNLSKPMLAGTIYGGYNVVKEELPKIRRINILGFVLLSVSFMIKYLFISTNKNLTYSLNLYTPNIQPDIIVSSIALIVAIIAVCFSWYSWHRSRAIYEIKKYKFPKRVGDSKNDNDERHEDALNRELQSGFWTILYTYEHNNDELMIVIGRTKK